MPVYEVDGTEALTAYEVDGTECADVYDIDGTVISVGDPVTITAMAFNVGCFYSEWHPAPTSTGDVFYLRNKGIFDRYELDFCAMSEWYNTIGTVQASVLMGDEFATYYPDYTPYQVDGAALTSAFSVTPSNVTLVAFTNQGSETRYYHKSYATYDGKTVCCILTHLDLNANVRALQFGELMNVVANERYFIIAGDFNFEITTVGDSEYNASIATALSRGYHSAQNANGLLMTWYSGKTVESSQNVYALDNIITSSNIGISNVRRDETKLTDGLCSQYNIIIDHLPLIADLTIN